MDYRTKRQKLEAMANQNVSPKEAAIARQKIAELDDANSRGQYIAGSGITFFGTMAFGSASFTAFYTSTAFYATAFTRKATSK